MQPANEDERKNLSAEQQQRQETELSEVWRALLGAPSHESSEKALEIDPTGQVEPLAGDPWGHLLNAQGMQTVDLQKVRLHHLYPGASDEDIEHALNLMREATGQLRALNQQTGEREG